MWSFIVTVWAFVLAGIGLRCRVFVAQYLIVDEGINRKHNQIRRGYVRIRSVYYIDKNSEIYREYNDAVQYADQLRFALREGFLGYDFEYDDRKAENEESNKKTRQIIRDHLVGVIVHNKACFQ